MSAATRKSGGGSSRAAADSSPSPLLPIPEPAIRHHGQSLFGAMEGWLNSRRLPPVLLLTGLPGVGKRSMGYFLAQWIFCEKVGLNMRPGEGPSETAELTFGLDPRPPASAITEVHSEAAPVLRPCGQCPSCQKAIHGSWIDFIEITPEGNPGDEEPATASSLRIGQFRQLKATMGFRAHEGDHRVVLIPNADRMTVQAANSVLKLLEEPPAGWIFFLTASDTTLLLPTIVSRCQAIRLRPFPAEPLQELLALEGVDPRRREIASRLAQGSWGKALSWADEEVWRQRTAVLDFLREPASALGALVDWASQNTLHMERLIDQLESLAADLIQWSLGPSSRAPESHDWLNSDARPALLARARDALSAPARARDFWIARALQLAEARQRLLAPVNRKLFAQDLLIPWLEH